MKRYISKNSGYVLAYSVVIVGIMLVGITAIFNSSLSEAVASRSQDDALKAQYAAEAGARCVIYFDSNYQSFDTNSPDSSPDCGIGVMAHVGGKNSGSPDCIKDPSGNDYQYTFTLSNFTNGSCATVHIEVIPRLIPSLGVTVCDLQVESNGRNSCTATGPRLVERTRWVNL